MFNTALSLIGGTVIGFYLGGQDWAVAGFLLATLVEIIVAVVE